MNVPVSVCLSVGGCDAAQWEDITGSTEMSVVKGCVSFTSAVSARSDIPTHTAFSVFLLSLSTTSTNATDTLLPTHRYQHIATNTLL